MDTIERLLPEPHFQEHHQREIPAPPSTVWEALDGLRSTDLRLSMGLIRLASGNLPFQPAPGEEKLQETPALDAFAPRRILTRGQQEIVLVDIAQYNLASVSRPDLQVWDVPTFAQFNEPGWCKVAMNFLVSEVDSGTLLRTQTRVHATSLKARLKFTAHWAMVRAGSGLIRRDILNATHRAALGEVVGERR